LFAFRCRAAFGLQHRHSNGAFAVTDCGEIVH
jgi:hypothetical protein